MEPSAEQINLLSNCVNLLTRARLMLPWQLEIRQRYYYDTEGKQSDESGDCGDCGQRFAKGILYGYSPVAATTLTTDSDWFTETGFSSTVGSSWRLDGGPVGICDEFGNFVMATYKITTEYRFRLTDPLAWFAVHPDIQALVEGSGTAGFFGYYTVNENSSLVEEYTPDPPGNYDPTAGCGANTHHWFCSGRDFRWLDNSPADQSGCAFYTSGLLDVGAPISGDFGMGLASCGAFGNQVCPCNIGTGKTISVLVKNTQDLIIVVPTV
jgi:hypothetical protein